MKHFGNTLYVTTQGIYVRRDGTNLVMSLAREEKFRLPIHTISSVVSLEMLCGPCARTMRREWRFRRFLTEQTAS